MRVKMELSLRIGVDNLGKTHFKLNFVFEAANYTGKITQFKKPRLVMQLVKVYIFCLNKPFYVYNNKKSSSRQKRLPGKNYKHKAA